jgi:hypothetical protein
MMLFGITSQKELAKKYKALISAAIIKYKVKPACTLAKEIGLALLVLIIMFVLISY